MSIPPWLERGAGAIRPHPHRGDLIAAGVVPFTVGIAMVALRFDGVWGDGVQLALAALAAALVLGMGLLAPVEGEEPRSYQAMLLFFGLALLLLALVRLAQVLGVEHPLAASGSVAWIAAALALAATWPAARRSSAICSLIALVAAGRALVALVGLVFEPDGLATFRWVLAVLVAGFVAGSMRLRDHRPRHARQHVLAAGLFAIVLAVTFGFSGFGAQLDLLSLALGPHALGVEAQSGFAVLGLPSGPRDVAFGWELVLAAAGFGLVAYAGVERARGPAYAGVIALALLVLDAGAVGEGGASLIGWPAVLVLAGGAMIGFGLRPIEPLPPEPGEAADVLGGPATRPLD